MLDQVQQKARNGQEGAAARDVVMMFKDLVIQNLYGLADEPLDYPIEDRRSFRRQPNLEKSYLIEVALCLY